MTKQKYPLEVTSTLNREKTKQNKESSSCANLQSYFPTAYFVVFS